MRKTKTLIPAIAIALLLTASCGVLNQVGLGGHTYTFNSLPQNVDELTALSFDMTDPYG